MAPARIAVLVLAALSAIAAVVLIRAMSGGGGEDPVQPAAAPPPQAETARVLVSTADMEVGHRVTEADLTWREWPEDAIHSSFLTQSQLPDAKEDYVGAIVRVEVAEGEPLNGKKMVNPGAAGFMAAVLEPGMRAIAVPISAETGAGGFILPNDRVDVILTQQTQIDDGRSMREQHVSRTVLQNVRVLAIDQTFKEVGDDQVVVGSTATLELAPAEAETLTLAEAMGDIALSLRSVADIAYTGPMRNENSLNRVASTPTVRVIRYGNTRQVSVQEN